MSERAESQYDLTSGDILKKLLLVAVPIMGTQLMQMSYNLTDMFWLGRFGNGSDAVASSGTAGMFMWLSMAFLMIGRMGAEIGVAQSRGRGDIDSAICYAQNSIFLAALLGSFYGLVLNFFRGPLVGFFNIQEAHVAKDTRDYLAIVAMAMPLNFISSAIVGAFNASGNSGTPFIVNAVGLVANMILDPLFIFGFNMGIRGAAVATLLAQAISFSMMLLAMLLTKNRPFAHFRFFVKPSSVHINRILKWSIPIGLESMLFTGMSMVTARFVASFGATATATSKVGSQIESLSWLIGGGFGSALTAFMGQNFGAKKWKRFRSGFALSAGVMLVWGVVITAVIFFCAAFLFSIFLPDTDILPMGVSYLHILALCQLPQCFEAVSGSAFKGSGRTIPPTIVSITSNVIRVVLAFFLSKTALGLKGIWIAISLTAALRGSCSFIWGLLYVRKFPKEDEVQETSAFVPVVEMVPAGK